MQRVGLPVRALKAGDLVSGTVLRLADNGLVVRFTWGGAGGASLIGVVDQSHLPVHCKAEHWRGVYAVGDAIPAARILTCDLAARAFSLTLRPHLLSLRAPTALADPGVVLENAEVSIDERE